MKTSRLESKHTLYPNNLPLQLNSFIGRERELDQLRRLIWSTRLLTLTGPGGSGKTRLAIKVAEQLLDAFHDGVWFVDLGPLQEPELVPQAVAAVFSVHEPADRSFSAALSDYLRPREILLFLDNCEHVLSACAELATILLRSCPNLFMLATSREAFNIDGEIGWQTQPLSVPDAQSEANAGLLSSSEASQLFLDRATAVQPGFSVNEHNAPLIAQICRQLDGLPLAIELAAARIRSLPVEEIASRLDDRFDLLNLGRRTAPARHQTLRAMIDWSYGLLSSHEKKLFRRLAVFSGGWTITAAVTICSDSSTKLQVDGDAIETLDALARLVDKSLVIIDKSHTEARYRFLETIREYASEKLGLSGEAEQIRDRHLDFCRDWAEKAEINLHSTNQTLRLERYDAEYDNLRAALVWSLAPAGKVDLGQRLAACLGWFWSARGYFSEARDLLAAILERTETSRLEGRAKALYIASGLAFVQTDYPATRVLVEESLSIYRELGAAGRFGLANVLIRLGDMWRQLGRYETAFPLLEDGLRIMRELNDIGGILLALWQLGYYAVSMGDYRQAEGYFQEALPLSRQNKDEIATAIILSGLGETAVRRGDFDRAEVFEEESLKLRKEIGEKWGIAVSLANFAWITIQKNDFGKARTLLLESLILRADIGDRGGMAWCLEKLAKMNILSGQKKSQQKHIENFQRAARLFGAASTLRAPVGSVIDQADLPDYEHDLGFLKAALGEEAFSNLWKTGETLPVEEVIEQISTETTNDAKRNDKEKFVGLSARERNVAALIAEGKSNREIAKALTVEIKTIEAHITHIFNKLGFDSRVQIAVWAVEKGLARSSAT